MTSRIAEHRQAFAYGRWANRRLLAAVAELPPEARSRDLGSSFPSVLETLRHILAAEWIWLRRWQGGSPKAMPDAWRSAGLDELRSAWTAHEEEQGAFADALREEDLDAEVAYRNLAGEHHAAPLWQLLRHVVNHSTYHRGQVTTMLRQLGAETVGTDLSAYFIESGGAR